MKNQKSLLELSKINFQRQRLNWTMKQARSYENRPEAVFLLKDVFTHSDWKQECVLESVYV